MFVVLEGPEGSGKTTVQEELNSRFLVRAAIRALRTESFPRRTNPLIKQYLSGISTVHPLVFQSECAHDLRTAQKIAYKYAGHMDNLLIASRWTMSPVAYGMVRTADLEPDYMSRMKLMSTLVSDIIHPDLTFVLIPDRDHIDEYLDGKSDVHDRADLVKSLIPIYCALSTDPTTLIIQSTHGKLKEVVEVIDQIIVREMGI